MGRHVGRRPAEPRKVSRYDIRTDAKHDDHEQPGDKALQDLRSQAPGLDPGEAKQKVLRLFAIVVVTPAAPILVPLVSAPHPSRRSMGSTAVLRAPVLASLLVSLLPPSPGVGERCKV